MKELDKKYYDLYLHVHTKLENFDEINNEKNKQLDSICKIYLKQNRNIENPSKFDINWITSKIKKLNNLSVEKFLERCNFLKEVD